MYLVAIASQDAVAHEVPQPGFQNERPQQAAEKNRFPALSFFDGFNQSICVDNSHRITDQELIAWAPCQALRDSILGAPSSSDGFRPIQDFRGDDIDERALH